MSSPATLQSRIAFMPASVMRLRKLDSQSSPNFVRPTPMTATSRILGASAGELDLAAVLGVGRVIERDRVGREVLDGRGAGRADLLDPGRDREVEGVAAGAGAVPGDEDPVVRLRDVEHVAQPQHDGGAVRVADP